MDALTALTTRTSPMKLAGPGPTRAEVERMLETAVRAPDHGKLKPWRFIVIEGAARERLGAVMAEALRRREPQAPAAMVDKEREKPLRAPIIIVVAAKLQPDHPKIPRIEQIISAGTAAQNIQIAAHAMGFGAMWRTGPSAYDSHVKKALDLAESDEIVGLLYLGNVEMAGESRPIRAADYIVDWR